MTIPPVMWLADTPEEVSLYSQRVVAFVTETDRTRTLRCDESAQIERNGGVRSCPHRPGARGVVTSDRGESNGTSRVTRSS